jgi:hypothetical protein
LPIHRSKGRVCVVNREQLAQVEASFPSDSKITCADLQAAGIRHGHITKGAADDLSAVVAMRMIRDANGAEKFKPEREAGYVGRGKALLVYERSRYWRKVFSGGFSVMQLVYGGSAL